MLHPGFWGRMEQKNNEIHWNLARRAGGQVVRKIYVIVSALTRSVSFYGARVENGTRHTIEFQAAYRHPFVGDGFPVPLHSSLFSASPNPFGRLFRLLREAKRLPYALQIPISRSAY